jgi:hypothetical protein
LYDHCRLSGVARISSQRRPHRLGNHSLQNQSQRQVFASAGVWTLFSFLIADFRMFQRESRLSDPGIRRIVHSGRLNLPIENDRKKSIALMMTIRFPDASSS